MICGFKEQCRWALREMIVAKRLPIFHWNVWLMMLVFSLGVAIGVAIGVDQASVIADAAGR